MYILSITRLAAEEEGYDNSMDVEDDDYYTDGKK
jgi:hypothetical protein